MSDQVKKTSRSIPSNPTGQSEHPGKRSVVSNEPPQPSQLGSDSFSQRSPKAKVSTGPV